MTAHSVKRQEKKKDESWEKTKNLVYMAYLPRHEVHKKKKSRSPIYWVLFFVAIGALVYSQEKKIRLLLAGDLRQKIEKQKEKIQSSLEKNELTEVLTRDFHSYTSDFLEKEPLDPMAHYFRAEAFYYDLLMSGIRFDSFSLTKNINHPLREFFGDNEKVDEELSRIYENARRAQVMDKNFPAKESNRFFLFLGEVARERKKPGAIHTEYGDIDLNSLDKGFYHAYIWILFYNTVRVGDVKKLDSLLEKNKEENAKGKLLFTDRETDFLQGVTSFHARDYVPALNSLRRAKTENPDAITVHSTLTEARIFYLQNLPQKGIDLLTKAYKDGKNQEKLYLKQLKNWAGKRPDLEIQLPEKKPKKLEEEEIP